MQNVVKQKGQTRRDADATLFAFFGFDDGVFGTHVLFGAEAGGGVGEGGVGEVIAEALAAT